MNKNKVTILSMFLIISWSLLTAQELKLPLNINSGHLNSVWQINDSIKAKVFIETGFPKIVINESFALNNLQNIVHIKKAPEDAYIALWGNKNKIKVSYVIKDSLIINGKKKVIDALVADLSTVRSWRTFDIIYSLRDLSEAVEINIKENYMIIDKDLSRVSSSFLAFNAKEDKKTKGLYITTAIKIYDSSNSKEELKGNFLFDLGAPNAMFINRNLPKVEDFISNADRFILKDTTKFRPNSRIKLAILMPTKIQIENIILKDNFIVAMNMFKSTASNNYVGMIGNKFLANFILVLDFVNNKLYLKPNTIKVDVLE